jgi:tetratricopeptide (TPR) repeat protein
MSTSPKFRAFLSYSRRDEAAVRKLHQRLERYSIPRALRRGGSPKLGRFFRDKDELPASAQLSAELEERIASAEWLIVCCSPAAAQSKWVNAEVEAFTQTQAPDRVLTVVLEGEPHDVFPPALRAREPLAADFRTNGDGEDLGFLKLVAGIIGVDLGELRDREAAAQRARLRLRAALAGVFALLAIGAGVSAFIAVQQRDRAEAMAREAIDIGAGVVQNADDLSRRLGVPTSALEQLLDFASHRFDRLFGEGIASSELERQRASLRVQFSELYGRAGNSAKQREEAQAALAMFERFPTDELRTIDYVRALAAAGQAELALGREQEAIRYATRAVDAARVLRADIPEGRLGRIWLAAALQRLGEIHMRGGRPREALPLATETVALLDAVVAQTPDDDVSVTNLVAALDWLGGAQSATGDRVAAKTTLARSVETARAWAARSPESLPARSTLSSSLMKLGQTLADERDSASARAPFEESVAIARELVASDSGNAEFKMDLALRLMLTANVLAELGEPAQELTTEGIAMARAQVRADPADARAKETLARILAVRAARLSDAGDNAPARTAWREIAELRREMRTDARARTPDSAASLANAYEMVGDASAGLHDLPSMLAAYGDAVPLRREAVAAAPDNAAARASLAAVLHAQGLSKSFNRDGPGALAALDEAARIRTALAADDSSDRSIAFHAADSLQQLALVQSASDGEATRRSLEQAKAILERLVAAEPENARYADSLQRTNDVLASIPVQDR